MRVSSNMIVMGRMILIVIIGCFPVQAYSLGNFRCKVEDAVSLDPTTGKLTPVPGIVERGEEFVVNRENGQITGQSITNTMSGQMPEVYDYMPSQNGFKAITVYQPNQTVDYLEIRTYEEAEEMPFLYKSAWGLVVSGLCTFY